MKPLHALLLILLCAALYLPGLAAVPATDRDEARFTVATRQMVETGDYLDIRFQDEPRYKKPPGIYWLQALSLKVTAADADDRAEIWRYRLPSALAATLAVLLTASLGARLFGATAGLLAAAMLAASALLVVEAHLAKTDAALLVSMLLAQSALASLYLSPLPRLRGRAGVGVPLLFWLATAAAILLKGPVGPFISLSTILTLKVIDRRTPLFSCLQPLWGIPLLLALTLLWAIPLHRATDGQFLSHALLTDLLPKLREGVESHGFFPGFYLLSLPLTLWPASLVAALGFIVAWRDRRDPRLRFLLAWLLPAWIILELTPTRLPHYVLPLLPPLLLIIAHGLTAPLLAHSLAHAADTRRFRAGILLWLGLTTALAGALLALSLTFGQRSGATVLIPLLLAAILIPASITAALLAWQGAATASAALCAMLGLPAWGIALSLLLPNLNGLWLSRQVSESPAIAALPAEQPLIIVGFAEPSLVFELPGRDLRFLGPRTAVDLLREFPAAPCLVTDDRREAFDAALAEAGLSRRAREIASGLNYSKGDAVTLRLYTAE